MATYTNFCVRSGGSNLNAGAVDGSTTEPATSALVTYTAGDWNSATDVYTAPVAADMTEAVVGRFASLYHDGDTVPTANQYLVARITVVNAGTRQITLSTTARSQSGSEVATGTGNRSMRIGGAWAGPSGASGFPLTVLTSALTDGTNANRLNLKNDATYTVSANVVKASFTHMAGYASAYGDGGRAVVDGGTSGASYVILTIPNSGAWSGGTMSDVEFKNNGATGSATAVSMTAANTNLIYRCVVRDVRGIGWSHNISADDSGNTFLECEFYGCNQSNTANLAAVNCSGGSMVLKRCVFHDNAGSNTSGARSTGNGTVAIDCVFDTNGGIGLNFSGTQGRVTGCDFYNNGSHGVSHGFALHAENCNFVKNGGYGVNNTVVAFLVNCGFGSGTQVNASGAVASTALAVETGTITYAADVTPWSDPANGNFSITLAAAKNAGRGAFLETASGYVGTAAYVDVGAGQSLGVVASGSRIFGEGLNVIQVPQSTTRRVMLKLYLTGTTTAATGKTAAVTLSKAGAAFGNPSAGATNATELSGGWYYADLSTTDTGTLGDLVVRAAATGCDDAERMLGVVKATNAGWTALPDAAAEASGGLYTRGSGAGQIAQAANGQVNVNLDTIKTQAVTCSGGVTVPALIASTTNITAGTLTTVTTATTATNVTTVNGLAAGVITATSIAADAITADKIADGAIDTATFATGTTIPRVTLADTATNLTNAATAGDLTATMKTSVGTVVAASAVASVTGSVASVTGPVGSVTGNVGGNVSGSVGGVATDGITTASFAAGATLPRVTLADTLTTYTGDTPQTGDAYARIGAGGAGLTALGDSRLANLDATVSSRSTYAGGTVDANVVSVNGTTFTGPGVPSDRVAFGGTLGDQSAGNVYAVVLPSGPATNGVLVRSRLRITSGSGQYQERTVSSWDGANKIAGLDSPLLGETQQAGDEFLVLYDNSCLLDAAGYVFSVAEVSGLTAGALAQFFYINTTKTYADAVAGSVVKEIADAAGGDTPGTTTLLTRVTAAVALAGSAPGWYAAPVDVSADVSAIKAKTDNLPAAPAAVGDVPTAAQILTTTMTESYAAAGAGFSLAQALYELSANVSEVAFTGAAGTFYKRDHTTPAGTITLDSGTSPTLRKRAT